MLGVDDSVRKREDAACLEEMLGSGFTALVFDVTDGPAVRAAAEFVGAALKGHTLSALVNNAGHSCLAMWIPFVTCSKESAAATWLRMSYRLLSIWQGRWIICFPLSSPFMPQSKERISVKYLCSQGLTMSL